MIHTQKKNTEKLNGTLGPEQNLGWENGICTPTPHPTPSSGHTPPPLQDPLNY